MSDLQAKDLHTGYGRVEIVRGVSVAAELGQVTCIFGPNGSGKSTLLKAVAGAQPTWRGDIVCRDVSIRDQPTEERILGGIATMPQGGSVFPDLSVDENLRIGGHTIRDRTQLRRRVTEIYERFPALENKRRARGSDLSGGQQMLVSVGQLLMTDPQFLLLDEPSAGLAPAVVKEVFQMLRGLKEAGKGILMVEQNVRDALQIADQVYILVQGKLAYQAPRAEIPDLKTLMNVYMQV